MLSISTVCCCEGYASRKDQESHVEICGSLKVVGIHNGFVIKPKGGERRLECRSLMAQLA